MNKETAYVCGAIDTETNLPLKPVINPKGNLISFRETWKSKLIKFWNNFTNQSAGYQTKIEILGETDLFRRNRFTDEKRELGSATIFREFFMHNNKTKYIFAQLGKSRIYFDAKIWEDTGKLVRKL